MPKYYSILDNGVSPVASKKSKMGQMKKAKGNNSFPPPFPPVRKIKNADGTYTNVTSNDLAGMTSAKRIPKSPGALRTVRGRTAQRGIDQAKRQGVKSAKRAGKK